MSVKLVALEAVPQEQIERNQAFWRGLEFPKVSFSIPHDEKIAIVGGGRSIYRTWDEIRKFRHILAINATHKTLRQFGVEATFISVDPLPIVAELAEGATRAIVATRCDPSVYEALNGAQIRVFDTPGDVPMLSATAPTAVPLVMRMGFRQAVFFGCECSYTGFSHADRHEDREVIKVMADGKEFITAPDYFFMAREMAQQIRANPGVIIEKSGGLLRAMVRDPNAEAIEVGKLCLSE